MECMKWPGIPIIGYKIITLVIWSPSLAIILILIVIRLKLKKKFVPFKFNLYP